MDQRDIGFEIQHPLTVAMFIYFVFTLWFKKVMSVLSLNVVQINTLMHII